jgi:L-2-hydroxyglutarate oxidase
MRSALPDVWDYLIEKSPDSVHVHNAISPAFTSSLAFAEWIVDQSEIVLLHD